MNGRRMCALFAAAAAFLLVNSPVLGQMECCKGMAEDMGMGMGMDMEMEKGCYQKMGHGMAAEAGGPRYDPATEVTVSGVVEGVGEHPDMSGGTGVHLLLKTDQDILQIHLGPTALLAERDMSLGVGDELEIIGSRIELEGAFAMLARQVKKGDQILPLRTMQGESLWAGSKPGMSHEKGASCCKGKH